MTDTASMDSLLWVIANTDALVTSVAHGPNGAPGLAYLGNRKLEYAWETLQAALYYHDPDFFIRNLAAAHAEAGPSDPTECWDPSMCGHPVRTAGPSGVLLPVRGNIQDPVHHWGVLQRWLHRQPGVPSWT